MISLVVLFCSLFPYQLCAADDRSPVALGAVAGEQKGVVLGDYHQFDQARRSWGFNRYGGGLSYLYIGKGIGVTATDSGGVFLLEPKNTLVDMVLGLEPGSGIVSMNTNSSVYSYYAWTPMLSVGPKFSFIGNNLYVAIKGGGSVSDMGHNGLSPHARAAYGYGAYLSSGTGSIGASETFFGDNNLKSIQIDLGPLGGRVSNDTGLNSETSYVLLYKWRLE